MKQIPLSQEKFAIVDDEDYEWLSKFKWYASKSKIKFYAARCVKGGGGKSRINMHRNIMQPPEGLYVDHINGDTLDNRRENLRICTELQNSWNVQKRSGSVSKYKGVSFIREKWVARMHPKRKSLFLGIFDCEIEAALAYNKAAKEIYGEYAYLNVIDAENLKIISDGTGE